MAYDKDGEAEVRIDGQQVWFYNAAAIKKIAKDLGSWWEKKDKYDFVKINADCYMYIRNLDGESWAKLAGIKTVDFAVPQDWFDKHYAEIKRRGGAVWWYDRNKMFGEPLFIDQMKEMAMKNIRKHLPTGSPTTRKPVRRGKR